MAEMKDNWKRKKVQGKTEAKNSKKSQFTKNQNSTNKNEKIERSAS